MNLAKTQHIFNQAPRGNFIITPRVQANLQGFGNRSRLNLQMAKPGLQVGRSLIYKPPIISRGIPGQHVQANPGTEYTQQYIKRFQVSLASTFNELQAFISGTNLWYVASTNTTDQILVRIGSINADQIPWSPGNGIEGIPFSQVFISNGTAVAGATATLVYFTDTPEAPVRFF